MHSLEYTLMEWVRAVSQRYPEIRKKRKREAKGTEKIVGIPGSPRADHTNLDDPVNGSNFEVLSAYYIRKRVSTPRPDQKINYPLQKPHAPADELEVDKYCFRYYLVYGARAFEKRWDQPFDFIFNYVEHHTDN
ncbi:hypothetical protein BC833DRAFT_567547 [Globomyces pollinis-pini]|nr:hypothetical protein BC833DRAFT_567547 [Globomyces pollinis-pini]